MMVEASLRQNSNNNNNDNDGVVKYFVDESEKAFIDSAMKPYECCACNDRKRYFWTKREYTNHMTRKHPSAEELNIYYLCNYPECFKKYTTKDSLLVHKMRKHGKNRCYQCQYCDRKYCVLGDLMQHKRRAHRFLVDGNYN